MRRSITLPLLLTLPLLTQASVSVLAEYRLGESGSLGANNQPQDASGNGKNFTNQISGATALVGTGGTDTRAGVGGVAGTSSEYLDTSNTTNGEGWYGADFTSLFDNYAYGIFVQAAGTGSAEYGTVFSLGGATGTLSLSLEASGWRASRFNQAYIGSAGTFTANTWVHLAIIRSGGVNSFYVDGLISGATDSATPTYNGGANLSVSPGGGSFFDGKLDEARVVTFTAGESTANIITALQTGVTAIPEPSTYGLMGAGALAGVAVVRRRRNRA